MDFQQHDRDNAGLLKTVFRSHGRAPVYLKSPDGQGHYVIRFNQNGHLEIMITEGYLSVRPRSSNVVEIRRENTP